MDKATFERLAPTDQQLANVTHMRGAFGLLLGDRTYVIRQLRTCAMWCNMAITHQPDGSARG
jgi:hypothetical protein